MSSHLAHKKSGKLIFKIIFALIVGAILGRVLILHQAGVFILRSMVTVSDLLSQFLSFFVPIVVLILVLPGIIELGSKASKILMIATGICYTSMILVGFLSISLGNAIIPKIFAGGQIGNEAVLSALYPGFLPKLLFPFFDVISSIVLAFSFGIAAAVVKSDFILTGAKELAKCIFVILDKFLIPALPFYILCIFCKLSASGELIGNLKNLGIVIVVIAIIANTAMVILLLIACIITKRSFLTVLKAYVSPYLTAFGTQSSQATVPISLIAAENIGISKEIANFSVPLLATTHLIGSMVTQIIGAMAVYYIFMGKMLETPLLISYMFLVSTILFAAPGIPGGEPVATKPLLGSFLGFPPLVAETMFTLGVASDSFSTSVNVAADGFVVMILDKMSKKFFHKH